MLVLTDVSPPSPVQQPLRDTSGRISCQFTPFPQVLNGLLAVALPGLRA